MTVECVNAAVDFNYLMAHIKTVEMRKLAFILNQRQQTGNIKIHFESNERLLEVRGEQ